MSEAVIYTCITGGYDTLRQPLYVDSGFDYVCFVEPGKEAEGHAGVWELRPLPSLGNLSPHSVSRWPKLNPHLALPEYRYSVWVDGNVTVADAAFYDLIRAKMASGTLLSAIKHPFRDDVYEEAYRCLAYDKETFGNLLRTVSFLKKSGYPRHAGLFENGVLLRLSAEPSVVAADELWWKLFLEYSCRDQLTSGFSFRSSGLVPDLLVPEGMSVRNHPFFVYEKHEPGEKSRDSFPVRKFRDACRELKKLAFRLLAGV